MTLNKFRTKELTWDKAGKRIYEPIEAHSGDSNGRKLVVQVLDGGEIADLTEAQLYLSWKSYTNKHKGLDAFKAVDLSKGIFEIAYTTEMLSNVGNLRASLVLIDKVGRVESKLFTITVSRSNVDDESVQSEDSFTALTQALAEVQTIKEDEIERVANETVRLSAETDRKNAETIRLTNETDRVDNEEDRVAAESGRVTAEIARVSAENARAEGYPLLDGRLTTVEQNIDAVESHLAETTQEIIAARDGEANLKARLDKENQEVTAQLAQKVGNGTKAELEDLSPSVLSAIEGGEGTSFSLLSIPQDRSVSYEKTTFLERGENLFDSSKARVGNLTARGEFTEGTRIVSDFIPINNGDGIYFAYGYTPNGVAFNNQIFLYGKDYNYLGRNSGYVSGEPIVNSEVKYIRTALSSAIGTNNVTISFAPLSNYVPYYTILKNVKIDKDNVVGGSQESEPIASHLKNKKLVCFGDSITGKDLEYDYPSFIAERTGMEVFNVGFGGTCAGNHYNTDYNRYSFYNLVDYIISGDFSQLDIPFTEGKPSAFPTRESTLKNIDFNEIDYITIAYGANDWGDNTPNEGETDEDTTSFKGALRYGLRRLLETYPHLQVLIISPFYRWFPNNVPINDSDDELRYDFKLYEYVEATEDIAKEFKVSFYNAFDELGINKYTRLEYFSAVDGTHHDARGRKLIGYKLSSALISKF